MKINSTNSSANPYVPHVHRHRMPQHPAGHEDSKFPNIENEARRRAAAAFQSASQSLGQPANEPEKKFGDLNGDSIVDGADLGILLGQYGSNDASADLDKNGTVDASDLKLMNEAFQRQINGNK